jgi:hypothetical protein
VLKRIPKLGPEGSQTTIGYDGKQKAYCFSVLKRIIVGQTMIAFNGEQSI